MADLTIKPLSSRRSFWFWQANASPYLFVLPFVVLFLIFMCYPLARSIILSFYRSAGPRENVFIGLTNYKFLLRDWLFWKAVLNTLIYTVLLLSLQIPLSLGLAMLLNSKAVRFRNFFRFAFFSSHLVGNVFVAVLFMLLLAPRQGLINRSIGLIFPWIGIEIDWRNNATLAIPAIVIASLWLTIGWGMIYFLAALQAVDQELYEAAEVDGAGHWQRFRHVTLPGIRPVLIFMLLVGTIGALQLFELPYVFFDGPGPGFAGLTIVMYLYQQGFEAGNIGYAAAIGWVLVLMIFFIAMAQLKSTGALKETT
ncbi:MAG TPA: sugar ABC transporter permease [Tepidisphaeraceae bacterium]|nr:sugar ABC transporter permease [Tepidisphaeraceae bacterium]